MVQAMMSHNKITILHWQSYLQYGEQFMSNSGSSDGKVDGRTGDDWSVSIILNQGSFFAF